MVLDDFLHQQCDHDLNMKVAEMSAFCLSLSAFKLRGGGMCLHPLITQEGLMHLFFYFLEVRSLRRKDKGFCR